MTRSQYKGKYLCTGVASQKTDALWMCRFLFPDPFYHFHFHPFSSLVWWVYWAAVIMWWENTFIANILLSHFVVRSISLLHAFNLWLRREKYLKVGFDPSAKKEIWWNFETNGELGINREIPCHLAHHNIGHHSWVPVTLLQPLKRSCIACI